MASSIEDILYAKALAEATAPDPAPYAIGGAAMGGLLGTMIGEVPHQMGRGFNSVGSAAVPKYQKDEYGKPVKHKGKKVRISRGGQVRPGFRAAGGLVGAIMGGALGMGVRDQMIMSSPELQMALASQVNQGLI